MDKRRAAHRRAITLAALSPLIWGVPAFGQTAEEDAAPPEKKTVPKRASVSRTKGTSPNAMVNLVNLLVAQGILKEDQARALIKQAEDEAYVSRQAAKDATVKADDAAKAASAAAAAASPPGARHVTYVPEIVKRELREEIKREVMATAEKENWASPGAYPEWAERIHFYGSVRTRYHGNYFPYGANTALGIVSQANAANFNAVNTGLPYDYSSGYFGPTYDVTQDRNRFRIRSELGLVADLTNGFEAGLRLATGQDNSPVSPNQTLGAGTGNFSKYGIWLDRSYLKYQWENVVTASIGRFDNPFWSPTDLVWWRDIGFDGFALQAQQQVSENFTPFAVAGAFPVFNTDFNIGSNLADTSAGIDAPTKLRSHDKYMVGSQLGFSYKFTPETTVRVSAAYFDFINVMGQLSSPCIVYFPTDVCDTDLTRPSFAQQGNSYRHLRNILSGSYNNDGTINQYQYFGLVSQFRPVILSSEVDLAHFNPVHVTLDGDYVVNTAFNRDRLNLLAMNNRAGVTTESVGAYDGGNVGWMARLTIGEKDFMHLWGWSVNVAYKYLQSDAVIDAFTDPDFGVGGTNLKGYTVGANLGLSKNVWATFRWSSATNIGGSPLSADQLQVDLTAKF